MVRYVSKDVVRWINIFSPQALLDAFIMVLFQVLGEGTSGRGVTRLPVKQANLTLPDPTKTAPENWKECPVSLQDTLL